MKTATALDPAAAFQDPQHQPTDHALEVTLGDAFAPIALILTTLRATHPDLSFAWQYSPKAGWHRVAMLQQRRLFFLLPKLLDFRLSLIVGARAIASLARTSHAAAISRLLQTAKCYPEGTAFSFDRASCDPGIVLALLEAKLAH